MRVITNFMRRAFKHAIMNIHEIVIQSVNTSMLLCNNLIKDRIKQQIKQLVCKVRNYSNKLHTYILRVKQLVEYLNNQLIHANNLFNYLINL